MSELATMELLWFLAGLALILAELFVPGFVIIFFGLGAWITASLIALGIIESFNTQLLVFIVSSLVTLLLFRRQGKHYFEGRVSGKVGAAHSMEDVRGERAVALTDIHPNKLDGEVEFNGSTWKAVSDVEIRKGSTVEIVERNNLVPTLKPIG
jgi:membrane protein implicated in regulation of membrane protease activity